MPQGTPLEVLVLGAGTGGPVSELLTEFDPSQTKVTFAETDAKRSTMAEQKFFDHSFVEYAECGLISGKAGKVFRAQRYDLVIIVGEESAHALSDKGAKRLLRSLKSEALCLIEGTVDAPLWSRLVFGLDPAVEAKFLPASMPSVDAFQSRLLELGFSSVDAHRMKESGRVFAAARGPVKRALRKSEGFSFEKLRYQPPTVWVLFEDEGGVLGPVAEKLAEHPKDRVIRVVRGDRFKRWGMLSIR